MVTVDTYRIGAFDHLARYGEIMGVPTHVAHDASTLNRVIGSCSDADLVLVDTAGRPQREAVDAQAALLRAVAGLELIVVLSAATARAARRGGERYASTKPERLIITRSTRLRCPAASCPRLAAGAPHRVCGQRPARPGRPAAMTAAELLDLVLGEGDDRAARPPEEDDDDRQRACDGWWRTTARAAARRGHHQRQGRRWQDELRGSTSRCTRPRPAAACCSSTPTSVWRAPRCSSASSRATHRRSVRRFGIA